MGVYHNFFLIPGSGSTIPEVDPDLDPAKWHGSDRIRIQNTIKYHIKMLNNKFVLSYFANW